ncbi:MAG TPA: T9SS type A sorting domain-containing protein [Edaphocola sp.]|nr:T9SS type A sorting domain-containing protein [Edaphocola sp.]
MKKSLIILAASLFGYFTASAQTIKNADISVQITAPSNNTVVPYGDSVGFSFNYTNHGPDILPNGDSLFFFIPAANMVFYVQLTNDFPVGATLAINEIAKFYNPGTEPLAFPLCLLHVKQSDVTYQGGGVPNTTYVDSNAANDTACIDIVFAGANTSVGNVAIDNQKYAVYPNPATDKILLPLLESNNPIDVQIVNQLGQKVWKGTINNQAQQTQIEISGWAPGVYFVHQTVDGKTVTSKFIKQ